MGSSHIARPAPTPEFLSAFRARAAGRAALSFAEFMDLALYDAQVGYYRANRQRIGYAPGTDFYTATTSGPIFGELVVAACRTLLGSSDLRDYTFVELGAEPSGSPDKPAGILAGVEHPFGAVRALGVGAPLQLSGRCVVFSNELFDAQPFRRFVFREAGWRELGVELKNGGLAEVEMVSELPAVLPAPMAPGYVMDLPLAAATLAGQIAAQAWTGLFVACDYGKSWRELVEVTPGGTARAYFRHTQSNDLLASPGEQDLTCHICWDWLEAALAQHGFVTPTVEAQEAFFTRHAGEFIAGAVAAEATRFSQRKLALIQLLHPAHLGRKFQILHARRG